MITQQQKEKILKIREQCTKCGPEHKGFLPVPGKPEAWYKCECTEKMGRIAKYYLAGIPEKYIDLELTDFLYDVPVRVSNYLKQIDKWIKRGVGLYLHGLNGSGKTFLMSQIAKRAIDAGYSVKFFKLNMFIDQTLKSTRDEQAAEFLQEVKDADLICVDEVEKIHVKYSMSTSVNQLAPVIYDDLFRSKSHDGQTTCVTSNCDLASLEKLYGPHLVSMFKEIMIAVEMNNSDIREAINEQNQRELDGEE